MSDQESDFPTLRTGAAPDSTSESTAEPLSTPYGVNESVELVIDLLAATRLVPEDKLAMARGRAKHTRSLGDALVEEGVASSDGIARMLAARHQLPLVDLQILELDVKAAREVPLHVLERVVAVPYAYGDGTLRIAVADPANLHGIDELRLATRQPLELGVASR
jgi:type IV pilus assembly protein PilB